MIELPEALTLAKEINENIVGKTVVGVHPPSSLHKFCWYNGDVEKYGELLNGHTVQKAEGLGIFVEIIFNDDVKLNFNDGVNIRLLPPEDVRPVKYQLLIDFMDGFSLVFTVAMYGGIICYQGASDEEYYIKSRQSISPLNDKFDSTKFENLLAGVKDTMSAKAFLATEQRIPGLGNGVLQDILFTAGIHPKRKVGTLTPHERTALLQSIKEVLKDMASQGGRDTEKDLFGNPGSYKTLLSKNTLRSGCPHCGGEIIKQSYLGGAIYYCAVCQPLNSI